MTAGQAGVGIRLLGPVQAYRDEAVIFAGSDRTAAVLCVLALQAGQPVTRDDLVSAVWDDDPPATARGSVYTYVSGLRRALDPGRDREIGRVLASDDNGYRLQVAAEAVDVSRFEALRLRGRQFRAAQDGHAELAALSAALELWRGEALAGVPGQWAATQRARLAELRLATAERHASLLIDLGRRDEAAVALTELAKDHPAPDRIHTLLERSRRTPGRRPNLVGRAAEVKLMHQALTQVAAGAGGHLRLEGSPGIGKSALLSEALRTIRSTGHRVGRARGDAATAGTPLATLIAGLESAADGVAPDWLRRMREGDADADAAALVERSVAAVRQACAGGPLVLAIDDLHLADPATLLSWAVLQRLTTHLPLLLISAARPDRPALQRLGWHGVIPLGPLSSAEATALARTAADELSEEAVRRVVANGCGNPAYLLAGVEAARSGDRRPGQEPPPPVVAAVTRHLTTLDEPTRHLLRAIAFLGDDCAAGELGLVTERPPAEIEEAVRRTRAAGFLTEFGDTLTFRHAIVARVLHDGTPGALRTLLHRSFAERLAEAGGSPERVVAHLLAAGRPLDARTAAWMARNVQTAAERTPKATLDLLRAARQQGSLDTTTRLPLTAWEARLLFRMDRNAVAEAEWVAARATDPGLEAEMRWIVALSHERQGDYEAAAAAARWVLSGRRAPEEWLTRFRDLLDRLRPQMGGSPTKPHSATVTSFGIGGTRH